MITLLARSSNVSDIPKSSVDRYNIPPKISNRLFRACISNWEEEDEEEEDEEEDEEEEEDDEDEEEDEEEELKDDEEDEDEDEG